MMDVTSTTAIQRRTAVTLLLMAALTAAIVTSAARSGFTWRLMEGVRTVGADPGVVRTRDGRYLMIGTGPRRGSAGQRRDDKGAAAYIEALRNFDSSAAPRHQAKVHDKPVTVQFGRKIRLGGGLFPRTAYLGGKFYAFVSGPNGYVGRIYDDQWRFAGIQRNLTPQGQREVDHDIAFDQQYIYHYAMLPGGAGQIRKHDSQLELVAQTPVFRAGPTDMILDQNIAVFGDRIYAGGEYREGGRWNRRLGEQNIPPDTKVSRGLHLRIYDKDLNLLDEKDLVGRVEGAAVPNQFWGLGVSQLRADGVKKFDPKFFRDWEARGHETDAHAHETHVSYSEVKRRLKAAGAHPTQVIGGALEDTIQQRIARFEAVWPEFEVLWGAAALRQSRAEENTRYVWRPAKTGSWFNHDPDGKIICIGGNRNPMDVEAVREAYENARPDKVNVYSIFLGTFEGPDRPETRGDLGVFEEFLKGIQELQKTCDVQWKSLTEVAEIFKAREAEGSLDFSDIDVNAIPRARPRAAIPGRQRRRPIHKGPPGREADYDNDGAVDEIEMRLWRQGGPGQVERTPSTVAADAKYLYVLRGNELHQLDAATLKQVHRTQLPAGAPRGFAGPGSRAAHRPMPVHGPQNHRILSATSSDGLKWSSTGKIIAEPGSVPDAVVGPDGRVRVYFCNPQERGITVGIEGPDGTWQFQQTNLHGADPNVLVLPSSRYRCFLKQGPGASSIGVADSENGVKFGEVRTAFWDPRYPNVTDSDAFPVDDGWVMYISLGPRLLLAESSDGLKFRAVRELDLGGSVSDTIKVDGAFRMYFHSNPGSTGYGRFTIWSAFSKDGRQWTVEDGPRLMPSADGPDRLGVADPAVIRMPDGTYRMFYKSFIREQIP